MTKMVVHTNNGVLAAVTEQDYRILQSTSSVEEAVARGVRWYVFITMKRALRSPDLVARVTATTEDWERVSHHFSVEEKNIQVLLSNGPLYWDAEGKYVGTWAELLRLIATKSA